MSYKLFLDDVREVDRLYGSVAWAAPHTGEWVTCRSMDEAVNTVLARGWPTLISFDHDLGDAVPTGMDFARWLVEHDLEHASMPDGFAYEVHSWNPVGAANIRGLMQGYLDTKEIRP
jgi:hypothetical protein